MGLRIPKIAAWAVLAYASATGAAGVLGAEGAVERLDVYVHPEKEFTFAIPPGAQLSERGGNEGLSIRSRKGYVISVQTGPASPKTPMSEMIGRLEARYLGKHKQWNYKSGERSITVGGLSAYDAVYEMIGRLEARYLGKHNARTRTRVVVIARGRTTDYVFMFFAQSEKFGRLVAEFDWLLDSFRPPAGDRPWTSVAAATTAPATEARPAVSKRFRDRDLGYAISYPTDWSVSKRTDFTMVFSGRPGTDATNALVSIQNVQPPSVAGPDDAQTQVIANFRAQLNRGGSGVTSISETPFSYARGTLELSGRQFETSYTRASERYRQWTVVIPRPGGTVVHVWSYACPEAEFDRYRPIAETMLASWTIEGAGS